jgi:hypothetical protein
MLNKFLVLALAACANLMSKNAFANEARCFKTSELFMIPNYGKAYREDDNLVIRKERYGNEVYYVARDMTSGTNQQITLLAQQPGKGLCKVLTTYPVSSITAIQFDKDGRPLVFRARDQGTTFHEIIYTWNTTNAAFKATACKELHWVGRHLQTKNVACDSFMRD